MESLISEICLTVAGKLKEEGNLLVGVPKEADKMLKNLKHIKTVMASAEKKALMKEEDVKEWISELKEVAYDIEDVLEDWSDFQLQMQSGEPGTSQQGNKPPREENQVCFSCIPTPSFCIKQVKGRHQIAHRMVEINERLDDIANRRKKFDFEKNYVSSKDTVEPESTSTPFADIVHDVPSQEEAKSRLIQKLVRDDFSSTDVSPNHIPIVSIVGMGGIGKTTLAQMVYNDQTVQNHFYSNHFSSKMIFWVCVSDNSTELKVAKAIAVALGLHVADLPDLTIVLTKIVDYIKDLTFLLVLDDVWENSVRKWDAILTCLGKADAKESRILLTTRSSDLAERMEAVFTLDVAALSEDDSWSLFSHYAFSRRAEEDRIRVEEIAKELVKKCKGLPLALQVLGKFMRTKRVLRRIFPGWIIDLTCLKYVTLGHIEDECLPPLGLMCSLEELEIRDAEKVEKVGDEFLGIPNSNYYNNNDGDYRGGAASPTFNSFPRLKKLTFKSMPTWEEWEDPAYRNNNNLIIMPHLWRLDIVGCETLKSLPQFFEGVRLTNLSVRALPTFINPTMKVFMPKMQNIATEDEPTRKMVKASSTILAQPDHFLEIQLCGVGNEWLCDWAKYCVRLTRLTLDDCDEASLAGLEVLQSLERLDLKDCGDVRRLGKEVLRISSLKELHLFDMRCLEEWEDPPVIQLEDESRESQHDISSYSTIRSNLRILSVKFCLTLKALPSFLRSTPLENLSIHCCPALETWWANEAGEDWRRWTSSIRQTRFIGKPWRADGTIDYSAEMYELSMR